jgi:hypothetical protein
VEKVLERYSAELVECIHLKGTGEITVKWIIEADGLVSGIEVLFGGVMSEELSDCFRKKMEGWNFPKPKDGRRVQLTAVLSISKELGQIDDGPIND